MDVTRIVIVDDQALVREGLCELMNHWPEFEVVGLAANGEEAIYVCDTTEPDLVLMDVQMPIMDGVEAVRVITGKHPSMTIVMLTVTADDDSLFGAIRNGARGYLLKDTPSKELREHLKGVVRGESPLSGLVATKLIKEVATPQRGSQSNGSSSPDMDLLAMFTSREIDILRLVAEDYSNVEIGAKLYLGAGTVKKHLSSIMQKLKLENRVQVATFAFRAGLMDQPID